MNQEQTLNDILETVRFLRDHGTSKDDLKATEGRLSTRINWVEQHMASKEDVHDIVNAAVGKAKTEIMTSVDAFVVLHKKLEEEQVASVANHDRLERYIHQLAKQANYRLQDA